MAMIDYGCWVIKNGVLVNEDEFFQNMKDAVGWSDDGSHPENTFAELDGNFFGYIGDQHLTVAFYKTRCVFVVDGETVGDLWGDYEATGIVPKKVPSAKSWRFDVDGIPVHVKNIDGKSSVFRLTMRYKGDVYRVIFGYGVDPNLKVWHRVKREYLGKRCRRVDRELIGVKVKYAR